MPTLPCDIEVMVKVPLYPKFPRALPNSIKSRHGMKSPHLGEKVFNLYNNLGVYFVIASSALCYFPY